MALTASANNRRIGNGAGNSAPFFFRGGKGKVSHIPSLPWNNSGRPYARQRVISSHDSSGTPRPCNICRLDAVTASTYATTVSKAFPALAPPSFSHLSRAPISNLVCR